MPLNILKHKSYNVYNAKNIERVRRDEALAREKEERDREAKRRAVIGSLRDKAGSYQEKSRSLESQHRNDEELQEGVLDREREEEVAYTERRNIYRGDIVGLLSGNSSRQPRKSTDAETDTEPQTWGALAKEQPSRRRNDSITDARSKAALDPLAMMQASVQETLEVQSRTRPARAAHEGSEMDEKERRRHRHHRQHRTGHREKEHGGRSERERERGRRRSAHARTGSSRVDKH